MAGEDSEDKLPEWAKRQLEDYHTAERVRIEGTLPEPPDMEEVKSCFDYLDSFLNSGGCRKYFGQWIAVDKDGNLYADREVGKLADALDQKGIKNAAYHFCGDPCIEIREHLV